MEHLLSFCYNQKLYTIYFYNNEHNMFVPYYWKTYVYVYNSNFGRLFLLFSHKLLINTKIGRHDKHYVCWEDLVAVSVESHHHSHLIV